MTYKIARVALADLPPVNKAATFPCCVYVVQQGDDGPVKIGVAHHPRRRLGGLQGGNPNRLYLRAVFRGSRDDCLFVEATVLFTYAEHALVGEWMNVAPETLIHVIQAAHDYQPVYEAA